MSFNKHESLTAMRTRAYEELFGGKPTTVLLCHALLKKPDERFLIDIFVYTMATESGDIEVAVTNGMSDQRMVEPSYRHEFKRRELIQYFPKCTEAHARRLHGMAWLPLFDTFHLDNQDSVGHLILVDENLNLVDEMPWRNAIFLLPLIKSHREFVFEVEGDKVAFLWHIPITDEERAYKKQHGADALIDRMDAVSLPWIFDEKNRPSLVEQTG